MTTTKVIGAKPPTWIRFLQIGIGAIAIGLSITAIIYPVFAIGAVFTVAAIILLLFGIERVVTGIFLFKQSRFTHIGLGILIIILSSLVMVYPLATATLVVWLAAIALLVVGISSLISGLKTKSGEESARKSSRFLTIGAGALAIALAITVMVVPTFGLAIAGIVIGIALLIYGIRLVVTGISRRHDTVTKAISP
jgi:uncharacterized membrane protein HdeD (DUF308 family)